MDIRQKEQA